MPYWENEDGTLEYSLLVTCGEKGNAPVDYQENAGRTKATADQRTDSASSASSRTSSTSGAFARKSAKWLGNRKL